MSGAGGPVSGEQHSMVSPGAPVIPKAGPHTSLTVTNHATPTDATATPQENANSAQSLLRDVQNESEYESRGNGSKRGVFQWRSRGSAGSKGSLSSSGSLHGKHYAKMGLVMDSPTKQATLCPRGVASESVDISGGEAGEDGDFEVVRLEGDIRSSPPISVKSESTETQREPPTSSPDSGYGNTPDNPGGEDHLTKVGAHPLGPGRARSGAINNSKRLLEETQETGMFGMDPSPGNNPANHTHNRMSPTHSVSPVPGAVPSLRTTPTNSHLASVDGGSSQDSVLVSASLSSAGDSREVEGDIQQQVATQVPVSCGSQSFPRHQSVISQPSRSASTYLKKRRGRTSSSKQLSKSTGVSLVTAPCGPSYRVSTWP